LDHLGCLIISKEIWTFLTSIQQGLNREVSQGSGIGLPLKEQQAKNMKSFRGVVLLLLAACEIEQLVSLTD